MHPSKLIQKSPLLLKKYFVNKPRESFLLTISWCSIDLMRIPCIALNELPAIHHLSEFKPPRFCSSRMCIACSEYERLVGFPVVPTHMQTIKQEPIGQDKRSSKTYLDSLWQLLDLSENKAGMRSRSISQRRLAQDSSINADFLQDAHIAQKLSDSCFWKLALNVAISSLE